MADAKAQMQALQKEMMAVKEKHGAEVKLGKADKDCKTFPWPIFVQRKIPRPSKAATCDVEQLIVKLMVEDADPAKCAVRVEIPQPELPSVLLDKIAGTLEGQWKDALEDAAEEGAGMGFLFESVLKAAQTKYFDLLMSVPSVVDPYEGCDDNGRTVRRFAISAAVCTTELPDRVPTPEPVSESDEEEVDPYEGMSAQEREAAEKEDDRQRRIYAAREKDLANNERDRLRKEAEEDGPAVKKLSKKEDADRLQAKRDGQGKRTAKTGTRAHKPVIEDPKEKAKREKENDEAHKKEKAERTGSKKK